MPEYVVQSGKLALRGKGGIKTYRVGESVELSEEQAQRLGGQVARPGAAKPIKGRGKQLPPMPPPAYSDQAPPINKDVEDHDDLEEEVVDDGTADTPSGRKTKRQVKRKK